ncbi:MAG: hypothetical protein QNK04_12045 [Myxococcota bacterium]|nr:hypothetical protein [Myxococcota bacterium]
MRSNLAFRLATFAATVVIGFGAAKAGHDLFDSTTSPLDDVVTSHDIHTHLGAEQQSPVDVVVDEDAVVPVGGAIPFSVVSHFEGDALVMYAVEFVDEFGNEVGEPFATNPVEIPAGGTLEFSLDVPGWLENGIYLYRVTLVGRSGDDVADNLVEIGFQKSDESAQLLDDAEILELSAINEGGAQ